MKEAVSATIGFAVAAVIPATAAALTSPGLGGGMNADAKMLLMLSAFFYMYSACFTALFGVPLFLLLRKFQLIRWWSAIVSGFAIGVVVMLIVVPFDLSDSDHIRGLFLWGFTGMLSAFVFWVIWRSGLRKETEARDA